MNKILILAIILLMAGIASADSYIYGNGQRVAKINESGVFYIHSDNLGSTSAITDDSGKVVEEQVNLPFGEPISGSERYGFTGKEHDETSLHYSMARYYNPTTGRFMNLDPIKDGFNWFLYPTNPLKFVDPDGRKVKFAKDIQEELRQDILNIIPDHVKKSDSILAKIEWNPKETDLSIISDSFYNDETDEYVIGIWLPRFKEGWKDDYLYAYGTESRWKGIIEAYGKPVEISGKKYLVPYEDAIGCGLIVLDEMMNRLLDQNGLYSPTTLSYGHGFPVELRGYPEELLKVGFYSYTYKYEDELITRIIIHENIWGFSALPKKHNEAFWYTFNDVFRFANYRYFNEITHIIGEVLKTSKHSSPELKKYIEDLFGKYGKVRAWDEIVMEHDLK